MADETEMKLPDFLDFEFTERQIEALKAEMYLWWQFEDYCERDADGNVMFRDETKKALHHLFAQGACVVIDQIAEEMRAALHLDESGARLRVTLWGDDLYDGTVQLDFRKMLELCLSNEAFDIHGCLGEDWAINHLRELAKMFSDAADRLSEQLSA